MKPLEKLTPQEKAELLFALFPKEIGAFLTFCSNLSRLIIASSDIYKKNAIDLFQTTELWFQLVSDVNDKLLKYLTKLSHDSAFFADQLFDFKHSMYTTYCLHQYLLNDKCNLKFKEAVILLFF